MICGHRGRGPGERKMTEPALAYETLQSEQIRPAPAVDRLEGVGKMDAAARLDLLMQAFEAPTAMPVVARPSKARWMMRARFFLACAIWAIVIGSAAGTLSSL
jgi:hypothetical protein